MVSTAEVEATQVGATVDITSSQTHQFVALTDDLIHREVGLDIFVALVNIGYLDSLAYLEGARIGSLQSHNHAEESSLARAVWSDDAHDTTWRKHKVKVLDELFLAKSFADTMCFNDLVAKTWTVGNEYLQLLLTLLLLFVEQLIVAVEASFAFCLTCLRRHANPFKLAFQRLAALACHLLFLLHALGLLFEPRGVIALPGDSFTSVELKNPACHIVEKIAVVRNGDNRALVLREMLLEPVNALCIQMVGWLVEQQDVWFLKKQATECHATTFTTTQCLDWLVGRWTTKRIHCTLQFAVQVPGIGAVDDVLQLTLSSEELVHLVFVLVILGQTELLVYLLVFLQGVHDVLHAFFHHLDDRFVVIKFGFLLKIADAVARAPHDMALILLLNAGNYLHERRLTRAVHADDAYLGAVEEGEVDVLEDLLLVLLDDLAYADHREDNLLVVCCRHI